MTWLWPFIFIELSLVIFDSNKGGENIKCVDMNCVCMDIMIYYNLYLGRKVFKICVWGERFSIWGRRVKVYFLDIEYVHCGYWKGEAFFLVDEYIFFGYFFY